jgi:basic amino acid/polyamine antiporter, APA family
VHPVHKTPHVAIVTQSLAALVLAVTGTFERLAILANVAALALYFGCALAAWRLRADGVAGGAGARVPLGGVAPFLAMPVILWLLTGLARDEWIGFAAVVAGGSLVYMMTRTSHRRAA